ncbi:GumC family protein [Fibrobacterota bacterium]
MNPYSQGEGSHSVFQPPAQVLNDYAEQNEIAPNRMVPVHSSSYSTLNEAEETLDVRDYLGVILHRRYWLLAAVLVLVVFSFVSKINLHPTYASTSRLRIISMTGIMDPWYGYDYINDNVITTHTENLKSINFLRHVVAALDTNLSPGRISSFFKVSRTPTANIINIQVHTPDPIFTARLANIIAKEYEKYDLGTKQKSFKDYEAWIVRQMKVRQRTLDSLETRIRSFYESNPTFINKGKDGLAAINNYENELTRVGLDLQQLNRQIYLIKEEMTGLDSQMIKEITYDKPLKEELLDMKLQLARLRTKYKAGHPKVMKLQKNMEAVRSMIRNEALEESSTTTMVNNPRYEELRNNEQQLEVQKDLLITRRNELQKLQQKSFSNLAVTPELELKLSQLTREKHSTEKMYFMLQEKLQETKLKKSSTPREVIQMDTAGKSGSLIPKKYMTFSVSLFMGLIIGVALCFLIDFLDTTVKKSKDLQDKYGLNLLGLIPKNDEETHNIQISSDNELIKPYFEPYRRLLANIFPVNPNLSQKSILVTSALQGEGKTTTAAYLATTSALKGERVLLVDADLRRHNIHNLFGLSNDIGLSDYLNGYKDVTEIIQSTSIPGLFTICAGKDPISLTQASAKKKLQSLIKWANKEYDLLILDSPPILQLSDTLTLAPLVSKTLVIFRSKKTPIKAGEEVLRQLHYIQANVAGGVLNDVSKSFWDQYYYQYYKYGYKYSYKS